MKMDLDLTVQVASPEVDCPDSDTIREWVTLALNDKYDQVELTVRIVNADECAELNRSYRNKPGPTNVLSFPYEIEDQFPGRLMGDIVICAPVVEREAREQGKDPGSHWAHMVIHGTLHLQGYDHINEQDAVTMESLEQSLMAKLGLPDPYQPVES